VRTDVSAHGDVVTVRVSDDGPGIPRDLAERVFLPHERGATSAPGAGLGLAIARGLVDAHGGTITLEPVAGGTSVAVTLPVEPVEAPGTLPADLGNGSEVASPAPLPALG
jgi:signal transduction histidine kinase